MAQLICSLPRLKHKTLHPFQPSQVSFQTHLTQTIIMEHSSIANPTDYKLWSGTDTIEWIISIDSSKFEKYREELAQSFKDHNFTGANISELDREDLKDYGIIDLEDRRAIYKAFIQLIATQKKRDSQSQSLTNSTTTSIINHQTESQDHEIKTSHLLSISDDEDNELDREYSQDTQSSFSETEDETYVDIDHIHILQQQERLITEGFCEWIPDDIYQAYIEKLTSNWIRKHYHLQYPTNPLLPHDLSGLITQFHGITFDSVVNDQCVSIESGDMKYSTTVTNIQLSKILKSKAESNSNLSIKPENVQTSILEHILVYLGIFIHFVVVRIMPDGCFVIITSSP